MHGRLTYWGARCLPLATPESGADMIASASTSFLANVASSFMTITVGDAKRPQDAAHLADRQVEVNFNRSIPYGGSVCRQWKVLRADEEPFDLESWSAAHALLWTRDSRRISNILGPARRCRLLSFSARANDPSIFALYSSPYNIDDD